MRMSTLPAFSLSELPMLSMSRLITLLLPVPYAQYNTDVNREYPDPSLSVRATTLFMTSMESMDNMISSTFLSSSFIIALSKACDSSRNGKTIIF